LFCFSHDDEDAFFSGRLGRFLLLLSIVEACLLQHRLARLVSCHMLLLGGGFGDDGGGGH